MQEATIKEILKQAPADFTANVGGYFSPADLQQILGRAQNEFRILIEQKKPQSHAELALIWNGVVQDFHQQNQLGFLPGKATVKALRPASPHRKLISYLRIFLLPTLFLKTAILYFGLKYAQYPDEGYGWSLLAAIALSLLNFSYFLWQSRHDTDEF